MEFKMACIVYSVFFEYGYGLCTLIACDHILSRCQQKLDLAEFLPSIDIFFSSFRSEFSITVHVDLSPK